MAIVIVGLANGAVRLLPVSVRARDAEGMARWVSDRVPACWLALGFFDIPVVPANHDIWKVWEKAAETGRGAYTRFARATVRGGFAPRTAVALYSDDRSGRAARPYLEDRMSEVLQGLEENGFQVTERDGFNRPGGAAVYALVTRPRGNAR